MATLRSAAFLAIALTVSTAASSSGTSERQLPKGLSDGPDWSRIEGQIHQAEYHLTWRDHTPLAESRGAWEAPNRGQDLRVFFTERGLHVAPARDLEPLWSWGISATRYGAGNRVAGLPPAPPDVDGNRAEYRRGDVVEWYVNEERGVEQGFTLLQPPAGDITLDSLTVEMELSGSLSPRLEGDSLLLLNDKGQTILRYGALEVTDSNGRSLSARLELPAPRSLALVIDARDASFPILVDPLVSRELLKLTAFDGAPSDSFGLDVAVDGNTIVVAAQRDNDWIGSAYVFDRNKGGADNWGLVKKIAASDGDTYDYFGEDMDLDGDTLVVGAFFDEESGNGVGSAYVFERNHGGADNWGQVRKLLPTGFVYECRFGGSVGVSGDTIAVGAWQASASTSGFERYGAVYIFQRDQGGVNNWGLVQKHTGPTTLLFLGMSLAISGDTLAVGGTGDDEISSNSGAIFVYSRNQGGADNWGQVKKIKTNDANPGDDLGRAIAISGDTIIGGARHDDELGDTAGAAYIFERNQGGADNWGQVKKLTASGGQSDDVFGEAVDIAGNTAIVGAQGFGLGAAFVFSRNQGGADNWGQLKRLTAADGFSNDSFGREVAISKDLMVVGANGDDDNGPWSGSAYVFSRTGSQWIERATPVGSDSAAGDQLGWSSAVDGDTLVVGAVGHDAYAGAAYVFTRNEGSLNGWGQVEKLTGSDTAYDYFGTAVDVHNDTVVVGARFEDLAGSDEGAAYVFERDRGGADSWGEVQRLTASVPANGGHFGSAVAVRFDTIAVGAQGADGNVGAAYVFERNLGGQDGWGQSRKVPSPDGQIVDGFGNAIDLGSEFLVVGAPENDQSCATNTCNQGAAYVFGRNQGGAGMWGLVRKLVASDATDNFELGHAVAIANDTILATALGGDPITPPAMGKLSSPEGDPVVQGTAYVFERNFDPSAPTTPLADNWGQRKKIVPSPRINNFGISAGMESGTAAVGATGAETGETGAVFVFDRNQGGADNWGQSDQFAGSDSAVDDGFGRSVGISGSTLVVGSLNHEVLDNATGAAYTFDLAGPDADLSITKTNNLAAVIPGTTTTYELRIDNAGTADVVGARVSDPLSVSEMIDTASVSWICAPDTGSGPATDCPATGTGAELETGVAVDVEAGDAVLFSVLAPVFSGAGGDLVNTAWVDADDAADPDASNNWSRDTDPLTPTADLSITKDDGEDVVEPGTTALAYAIQVLNPGPSDDYEVTISDTFPPQLTCDWTCVLTPSFSTVLARDPMGCPTGTQSGDIDLTLSMVSGSQVDLAIDCTVEAAFQGILTNTATVTPSTSTPVVDPDLTNNTATDVTVFGYDFGDAPDPTYPTLQASDGARHVVVAGIHLGAGVDGEPEGKSHLAALGDDIASDDEDGVVFTTVGDPGGTTTLTVNASTSGLLDAWVDFDRDGDWDDPGDQVFTSEPLVAGPNALQFAVPAGSSIRASIARFRFSTAGGLAPTGLASDGEVEDHWIEIGEAIFIDGFESGDTSAWGP